MSARTYLLGLTGCLLLGGLAIWLAPHDEVIAGFMGLAGGSIGLVVGYAVGFWLDFCRARP